MFNSDIPTRAELPSSAQLLKSTILALIVAAILLVTVVLPAEHAYDPTGIGRALKLTEMGEIKQQLAAEAAADKEEGTKFLNDLNKMVPAAPRSSIGSVLMAMLVSPAAASERPVQIAQAATPRSDETIITLKPTEGVEWKMKMAKGAETTFSWVVEGGVVNYDMHGTPQAGGKETSYKAERGIGKSEGTMTAGFDGSHGWFFRNRGTQPVTIRLTTNGAYTDLKRVQ